MREKFVFHDNIICYYTSPLLDEMGAKHMFCTRRGGVSEGVFESLNMAVGSGTLKDDPEKVFRNYDIAAGVFGLSAADVCRTYQNHTNHIIFADETHRGVGTVKPHEKYVYDGMVTETPGLLLSVRSADCVPILLYDRKNKICGAVHSGWRGTVMNIAGVAVDIMLERGSKAEDIVAAVGPCIGECCYEVGQELYEAFCEKSNDYEACFLHNINGMYLDLSFAVAVGLRNKGISDERISECRLCTMCREQDFFSHRRQGANRGTMSSFICL